MRECVLDAQRYGALEVMGENSKLFFCLHVFSSPNRNMPQKTYRSKLVVYSVCVGFRLHSA